MQIRMLCSVVALSLGISPAASSAATVTFGGKTWTVSTIETTFNDSAALLRSQPWWGDAAAAGVFSGAVGASFGFPNAAGSVPNSSAPYFAHLYIPPSDPLAFLDGIVGAIVFERDPADVVSTARFAYSMDVYAIATIPLPAGGLLLLSGLAAAVAVGKRRNKAAA